MPNELQNVNFSSHSFHIAHVLNFLLFKDLNGHFLTSKVVVPQFDLSKSTFSNCFTEHIMADIFELLGLNLILLSSRHCILCLIWLWSLIMVALLCSGMMRNRMTPSCGSLGSRLGPSDHNSICCCRGCCWARTTNLRSRFWCCACCSLRLRYWIIIHLTSSSIVRNYWAGKSRGWWLQASWERGSRIHWWNMSWLYGLLIIVRVRIAATASWNTINRMMIPLGWWFQPMMVIIFVLNRWLIRNVGWRWL